MFLSSNKHRFIFIHVYKNAGTSIAQALAPYSIGPVGRTLDKVARRTGLAFLRYSRYPTHARAPEVMSVMGRKKFKSYFSFAFVRNPWDWQVSLYTYMLQTPLHHQHGLIKGMKGFDEYIRWRCEREVRYQKDFVASQTGEILVDFVGRFERLDDDFKYVCAKIGVDATLPRANASQRKTYQEYYTPATVDLVRRTFEPDVRMFEYDFEF